ncbi:MAG: hypothetical protein ACKOEX_08775, partial [Planctomycetia bacterium]
MTHFSRDRGSQLVIRLVRLHHFRETNAMNLCSRIAGRPPHAQRRAFISVGAVGQQLTSLLMLGAYAVLRSLGEAAGRVDSSLRGHRSWRSQC